MTAYTDYLALIDAGFTPPVGPGRCPQCAFHTPTQGHRTGCPKARKPVAPRTSTQKQPNARRSNQEPTQ